MSIDEILDEIRALPVPERLRLIERVVHDVVVGDTAGASLGQGDGLLGLFRDDADLMDRVCSEAMAERHGRPWRAE